MRHWLTGRSSDQLSDPGILASRVARNGVNVARLPAGPVRPLQFLRCFRDVHKAQS